MNDFNPEHFMQAVVINLNKLRAHPIGSTNADEAGLNLVGNLFELGAEINNNLNRLAVAQEQLVAIAQADFAAAVEQEVTARVEPAVNAAVKETAKRSYIGKKPD